MTLLGKAIEAHDNAAAQKVCWHCGQSLHAEHQGYCLTALKLKQAVAGTMVRPRFALTDYRGETFGFEESGVIWRVTRSTVHVRDPRGHVHKRFAGDFTSQRRGFLVEEKHCSEWVR